MPRVTLQAYAEENNLSIRYVFDEELCKRARDVLDHEYI